MNWYTVKMVFILRKKDGVISGYDEQFRLIRAENQEDAWVKADLLGQLSQEKGPVSWEFTGITDIQPLIGEPGEGTELFYQIREPENRIGYEGWLKMKMQLLSERLFTDERVKV